MTKGGLAKLFLLGALAAAGCPAAPEIVAPPGWSPRIELTGHRAAEDRIVLQPSRRGPVLEVRSASGLGRAVIRAGEAGWPVGGLLLRFHLRGLEGLFVDNGEVQLQISWSTHRAHPIVTEARRPGDRHSRVLPVGDPLEIRVERHGAGDRANFLVRLPAAFVAGQPEAIRLRWVDFWR